LYVSRTEAIQQFVEIMNGKARKRALEEYLKELEEEQYYPHHAIYRTFSSTAAALARATTQALYTFADTAWEQSGGLLTSSSSWINIGPIPGSSYV
jgi:hypothetical protein